jgi:hypothetical protein
MSLRLARQHRWTIDLALGAVLVSGIAWLCLDRDDLTDAWRPLLRQDVRVHALSGVVVVFLAGTLWFLHMRRAWRSHRNRVAGGATFVLLALLVASGFALGYSGGGDQRVWIARAHWLGGFAGAVVYVLHRLRGASTRPPF